MKLCPHCEFIYEDDQSFCDMDGRELVNNPGQLAFQESAPTSAHLQHSAAAPVILTPDPAPNSTPGLASSPPSSWQSRSYTVAAIAGVLLATLLFVVYYARTHRSGSDNANQSQNHSHDQSTSRAPGTQPSSSDLVLPSAPPAENATTEQSAAQSPDQNSSQLASPNPTPSAQSPPPSFSPASEKSLARARQAPGPVSAAASSATNRAPVVIELTNGASIKADEAWERRDGIWYRQGGMVTFLKRSSVKAIHRLAPAHRSQPPTEKRETSIAQNQPRVGKSEVTTPKKESKVSSFLKKTGRILSKPFKF